VDTPDYNVTIDGIKVGGLTEFGKVDHTCFRLDFLIVKSFMEIVRL